MKTWWEDCFTKAKPTPGEGIKNVNDLESEVRKRKTAMCFLMFCSIFHRISSLLILKIGDWGFHAIARHFEFE